MVDRDYQGLKLHRLERAIIQWIGHADVHNFRDARMISQQYDEKLSQQVPCLTRFGTGTCSKLAALILSWSRRRAWHAADITCFRSNSSNVVQPGAISQLVLKRNANMDRLLFLDSKDILCLHST